SNFPSFTHNQAHPEPNRVAAACENFSLNPSNEPKASLIAVASSPVGSPPPFGLIVSQKRLWLKKPPPLFLTAGLSIPFTNISSIERPANSVPSIAAFRLLV